MSIDDLHKWREKFDKMHLKYWETSPAKPTLGMGMTFDKDGRIPMYNYKKKKKSALIYESIQKQLAK